jgi:phosphatidylserine decarboxylase
MDEIVFWNRENKRVETENVYGDKLLRLVYETAPGKTFANQLLARPFLSQAIGVYQDSFLSRYAIEEFIKKYQIKMDEYESKSFRSFNDFFIRKFKHGMRPFVQSVTAMPAFAEARYFAYESSRQFSELPIKGKLLAPEKVLGSKEIAEAFVGGPVLLARLCPVDYHRFHFPDHGEIEKHFSLGTQYHSVNPVAIKARPDVFAVNERQVSILNTKNFGKLAYVEVGAMCVGKIVQSHPLNKPFSRGDE